MLLSCVVYPHQSISHYILVSLECDPITLCLHDLILSLCLSLSVYTCIVCVYKVCVFVVECVVGRVSVLMVSMVTDVMIMKLYHFDINK